DAGQNAATFDADAYRAWRSKVLQEQFTDHFDPAAVAGRDVLDFGCGEGDLSFVMAGLAPRSIRGVDVDPERVASAQSRARELSSDPRPEFWCASSTTKIDLPDDDVDLILCFDVLEHVMDYEEIMREWGRVLRPGGKIFIWWVPWFHPYGPHIESLVPLPWAHTVFSDRALIETCARIYDLPEHAPRVWDLDDQGAKKPNKWKSMKTLPGVNRLTMRRFEKLLRPSGLAIARREGHGFQAGRFRGLKDTLARLPLAREFFSSFVIYELTTA
ncbi:MAG: class I SAM-dependent methyltransferase, partial [Planctomycetes bacterium]|nr:class I SAM-dependent methyltransferase [Planctomycetota bacterium]